MLRFEIDKLDGMDIVRILVPTMQSGIYSYGALFDCIDTIRGYPHGHYVFDFSHCAMLDTGAVCLLGAIGNYVIYRNRLRVFSRGRVGFLDSTMRPSLAKFMQDLDFLSHFSYAGGVKPESGKYLGFRTHTQMLDPDEIVSHLMTDWLSHPELEMSEDSKAAIASRVYEVFSNAYGHGLKNEGMGAVSCGSYDKKSGSLRISVVDFGEGVCGNVMEFKKSILSEKEAMEWALKRGHSTQTDTQVGVMPRGLGFHMLRRFVEKRGSLVVYSNSVVAELLKGQPDYRIRSMKRQFSGTFVDMRIGLMGLL